MVFSGTAPLAAAAAEAHAVSGDIVAHRALVGVLPAAVAHEPVGPAHVRLLAGAAARPALQPSAPWTPDLALLRRLFPEALLDPDRGAEFRWVVSVLASLDVGDDEPALMRFLDVASPLARQWGGQLERLALGDKGCTAVWFWGAPLALEHEVERAGAFLLALREAVATAGGPALRAGLTHHRMFVGFAGSERRAALACFGGGVTLAARLAMAAPSGAVWTESHAAARLRGSVELEAVEPLRLKGYADPVPAWALRRSARAAPRPSAGRLAGRAGELDRLGAHLRPLTGATPGFAGGVVVVGEPGVGKSHLVLAARRRLADAVDWQVGVCDQVHQPALHPLRRLLAAWLGLDASPADGDARRALARGLGRVTGADADARGDHDEILAGWAGLGAPGDLWDRLEPRSRASRLRATLVWLFGRAAARRPLVLQIEDIHWADAETRSLLSALRRAAVAGRWPLGLVFTSRPIAGGGPAPAWSGAPQPEAILLGGLDPAGVRVVAEAALGAACHPDLVAHLHTRAAGNPFFAQQLALALRESGRLVSTGASLTVTHTATPLPARVDEVLVGRLDRLGRQVRRAVLGAAVLGLAFQAGVHDALLGDAGAALRNEAAAQGVLVTGDGETWRFTHGLMRDAAYDVQAVEQRRLRHRQAAEALRSVHGDAGRHQAEIAWHFEQAGDVDAALPHLVRARGFAKAEYDGAARLAAGERLAALTRGRPEHAVIYYDSLDDIGSALVVLGRRAASCARMRDGLGVEGTGVDAIEASIDRLLTPGPAWKERAQLLIRWLDRERTDPGADARVVALMEVARAAFAASEAPGAMALLTTAHRMMAIRTRSLGRMAEARRHAEAALALIDAGHEADNRGAVLHSLARASRAEGDPRAAIPLSAAAVAEFRRLGQHGFLVQGLNVYGLLQHGQGDLHEAPASFEEAMTTAELTGSVDAGFIVVPNLSLVAADLGRFDAAAQALARGWALTPERADPTDSVRLDHAEAYRLRTMGDAEAALSVISDARQRAERDSPRAHLPFHLLEEGRALVATGRVEAARRTLLRAAEGFRETQQDVQLADVDLELARIGPAAEAGPLLAPHIAALEARGDRFDLARFLAVRAATARAAGDAAGHAADRAALAALVAHMGLLPGAELSRALSAL